MDPIELVVGILSEALTVPVVTDVPTERPPRLVAVDLEGDDSTPFLLRPRVAITCWGTTDRDACGLARSATQALQVEAACHPYLSSAELETMSREEWSRNGQSRYLVVMNLVINVDD